MNPYLNTKSVDLAEHAAALPATGRPATHERCIQYLYRWHAYLCHKKKIRVGSG